ncbi:hypothetical protein ACN47A_02925 [Myxococcus fulvus]|uniref:hypothetical protein n=1 Tax=Myxococcus fulvus TaxID=33 RepID=UPI003B98FC8A
MNPGRLPIRARITTWNFIDGVGRLLTEDGEEVRFGGSACTDFQPEQGLEVWLVELQADPLGGSPRAKVVNLSGRVEEDKVSQLHREAAEHDARVDRETALLESFDLSEEPTPSDYEALSPSARERLAQELMALRRTSHLAQEPFLHLVELDPTLFHPYLDELSLEEPESRAWADAPWSQAAPLVDELYSDWAPDTEPSAALALARTGQPEALRALARWLGRLSESSRHAALAQLLQSAGVGQRHSGELVLLHTRACLEGRAPDTAGKAPASGRLWVPATGTRCLTCGFELIDALVLDKDSTRHPWPTRLPTCYPCLHAGGVVHVELTPEGAMGRGISVLPASRKPRRVRPPASSRLALVPGRVHLGIFRSEPTQRHRLGGALSWIQGPEAHPCPQCNEPMRAAGQVHDEDAAFSDTGMLYAVACEPCRIITTFVQS